MISNQHKIKHFYWRSGFGLSPKEWKAVKNKPLESVIDDIFKKALSVQKVDPLYQDMTERDFKKLGAEGRKAILKKEKQLIFKQNAAWVNRMANPSESAFLEKMCLFWHGHFACITKDSKLAFRQLNTIRQHALGSFRDLVHALAKDVSMIRFLNNQQNRKRQPNENFARELMELFTIGRGHYSEQDIKEAARAFTGWSSDVNRNFKFKKHQHDFSRKTFMGKSGSFDGGDILDIILERKETAVFITRKIYRFFVHDNPNEQHIQTLSNRLYQSNYDIKDLMFTIFSSDWFYAKENVGNKIKSPLELLAGIMRSLDVKFDGVTPILFVERALGQVLFKPPNVAGWAGGKNWIDNSTLMLRLNLVPYLFRAVDINFKVKEEFEAQKRNKAIKKIKAKLNLDPIIRSYASKEEETAFKELADYLIQAPVNISYKKISAYLSQDSKEAFIKSLILRLMSLPEYQVC